MLLQTMFLQMLAPAPNLDRPLSRTLCGARQAPLYHLTPSIWLIAACPGPWPRWCRGRWTPARNISQLEEGQD